MCGNENLGILPLENICGTTVGLKEQLDFALDRLSKLLEQLGYL